MVNIIIAAILLIGTCIVMAKINRQVNKEETTYVVDEINKLEEE